MEFYEALENKVAYNLEIKEIEAKEFSIKLGAPAKIEAKAEQIVKLNKDTAIEYKVLDVNGAEVKPEKVDFESNKTITDGKIKLSKDGETAFVYVIVQDKDGKELAKSERITVKAEAAKAVEITNYTLSDEETADFEADNYKQVLTMQKGSDMNLVVEAKDQFDEKVTVKPSFESLDKTVALVDRTSGKVTGLKEGKAPVKITYGTGDAALTKTIELTIVADAAPAKIELDKNELNLSNKLLDGEKVEVAVKDQYDNVFKGAIEGAKVEAKVVEGKEIIEPIVDSITLKDGKATFTVKPVAEKSGKAIVEVTYTAKVNDKDIKFVEKVTVNVEKAGEVSDYKVEGFESELDKYEGKDNKNKTSMDIKVFAIDENGVKVGEATGTKVELYKDEVKDENKVTTEGALKDAKIDATKLEKDTEYTVVVKVETLTVFKDTFKVVDTKPAAAKPVLEQIGNEVKVSDTSKNLDLSKVFKVGFKEDKETEVTIKGITFKSDNAEVAKSLAEAGLRITSEKDGEATLVVDTVVVEFTADKDANVVASPYTIELEEPAILKLTVDAKAKAEEAALEEAKTAYNEAVAAAEKANVNVKEHEVEDVEKATKAELEAATTAINDAVKEAAQKLEGAKQELETEIAKVTLPTSIEAEQKVKVTGVESGSEIIIKANETEVSTIDNGTKFVTVETVEALKTAYDAAVAAKEETDAEKVTEAKTKLETAIKTFGEAIKTGTQGA
ncbi:S-layer protein precursor [Clostridium acetireducens DSM 10703]|uniref:S-layer protein n=1 Tax=Clostridium acetireducens DSM 10703 TaxID=1121290 RepID=A0A1E8EYA2_9CLOT|nr:S-layer protein precursor [Clostridium acetireducens DSM 10703]